MKLFLPLLLFLVPATYTHYTHTFLNSFSVTACNTTARYVAKKVHVISVENIALKGAASLFGITVMSYGCIAYFIYRVYTLIHTISSWLTWNEQMQEYDMIEEAKQYLARVHGEQKRIHGYHATRSETASRLATARVVLEQKKMLEQYLYLTTLLKKYMLRGFFMYDEHTEKQIHKALRMLHVAIEKSRMQDEHCS